METYIKLKKKKTNCTIIKRYVTYLFYHIKYIETIIILLFCKERQLQNRNSAFWNRLFFEL